MAKCKRCALGEDCTFRHGSPSGYVYHKCRCVICKAWRSELPQTHGTDSCGCGDCLGERLREVRIVQWEESAKDYAAIAEMADLWSVQPDRVKALLKEYGVPVPRWLDFYVPVAESEKASRHRKWQRQQRIKHPERYAAYSSRNYERNKERHSQSMREYRMRNLQYTKAQGRRLHERKQRITSATARRHGEPWTAAEDSWLEANLHVPVIEQAIVLQRTAKGVEKRRRKLMSKTEEQAA